MNIKKKESQFCTQISGIRGLSVDLRQSAPCTRFVGRTNESTVMNHT